MTAWLPAFQGWRVVGRRILLLTAVLSVGACEDASEFPPKETGVTRTIKVLSTRDDSPIAGVTLRVHATSNLWEYGPQRYEQSWELTTDDGGEIRVQPPAGTLLNVFVERAPYPYIADELGTTIQYYEKGHGGNRESQRYIYYLTPNADYDYEWVRYAFRSANDAMDGKLYTTDGPLSHLITMYSQARNHGKSARELAELRQFCRFEQQMRVEAANGWPTIGTTDFRIAEGQLFLNDCAASSATPSVPSAAELPPVPESQPTLPVTIVGGDPEPPLEGTMRQPPPSD